MNLLNSEYVLYNRHLWKSKTYSIHNTSVAGTILSHIYRTITYSQSIIGELELLKKAKKWNRSWYSMIQEFQTVDEVSKSMQFLSPFIICMHDMRLPLFIFTTILPLMVSLWQNSDKVQRTSEICQGCPVSVSVHAPHKYIPIPDFLHSWSASTQAQFSSI